MILFSLHKDKKTKEYVTNPKKKKKKRFWCGSGVCMRSVSYGENLIAPCSQVHNNFTMGVNRKILINLIYLFIQETYLTCANGLLLFIIYPL